MVNPAAYQRSTARWWVVMALAGLVFQSAQAQLQLNTELIADVGQRLFETFAPAHIQEDYAVYSAEDLDAMLYVLSSTLQGDDMAELAEYHDKADHLLQILQQLPFMGAYASWLETRMDYFDVAEESLELAQQQQSRPRPVAVTPQPAVPVLPAPTRPAPLPAPTRPAPIPQPSPPAPVALPEPTTPPPHPIPAPTPVTPAPVVAPPPADGNLYASSKATWLKKLRGRPMPKQAEAYLPRLKAIFTAEGIPPQLIWQAEAESSFNPKAKSPVGAVGLFQFMPATAKAYGMQTAPQDERLDPYRNAGAAAKYLRYLYGRFQSWPLALAAYNCGEGRVSKTMKRTGQTTFEGIHSSLPAETQMYVPKIAALIQIREGADLDRLPPPAAPVKLPR